MLFIIFNSTNSVFSLSIVSGTSVTSAIFALLGMGILTVQTIHFFFYAKTYYGLENTFNFNESPLKFRVFLGVFLFSRVANCLILSKV